jgi:hypothetical protein
MYCLTSVGWGLGQNHGGSGEQCTVVFALIVTELGSECVGWLQPLPPNLPLAGSVTIYAKTTAHCSPISI